MCTLDIFFTPGSLKSVTQFFILPSTGLNEGCRDAWHGKTLDIGDNSFQFFCPKILH